MLCWRSFYVLLVVIRLIRYKILLKYKFWCCICGDYEDCCVLNYTKWVSAECIKISENFGNPNFGVIIGIPFTRKLISFCQTIEHHILDDLYFHLSNTYPYKQKCKRQKPTDMTYSDSRSLLAVKLQTLYNKLTPEITRIYNKI